MAIGGLYKSRNLLARKRLHDRNKARRVLLESLETRQLLAVGPQLLGVQPNAGDLLENGEVLQVAPKELVFRFNDGVGIDPNTLNGIRLVRSGADGIFERASNATDFGTSGLTLVEFYAQTPGEAGNGIELRFTTANRNDSRSPVVRVSGRVIDVELNSNPSLETRVEDILQAFNQNSSSPATNLVYALRLRGSQTIAVGRTVDTTRPLVLTGANAAKGATSFRLSGALEARFIAREGGSSGLDIKLNVTSRDRGGAGAPLITVSGKTINVEVNSNSRFATTAREFVDALNANAASSALIEALLVSGNGATRIGAQATTYSPIGFTGVSDIEIVPAYVGLGDSNREVVMRFGESLPDDNYRVEILGQGVRTLRNIAGQAYNSGISTSLAFDLDLGVQILSVVPQPVTRDPVTGALSWTRQSEIDVYFNSDKLIDAKTIVSVNGLTLAQLISQRGAFYLQNTDTIVFSAGSSGQRGVLDPQFYQLINQNGTLNTADDAQAVVPSRVRYYPDADRVSLRYAQDLDEYAAAGGELRLRVGTNETQPLNPVQVDGETVDPADTFANAQNLNGTWTPGTGGTQAVLINSEITNTTPFPLDFPGANDEPGNRTNRYQENVTFDGDATDGITFLAYNFQGDLGVSTNSPLRNAITDLQKERVREVFSLYERYLGIRFVETASDGLTVAVGDHRAVSPFEEVVNGGVSVIELNGGFVYYEAGSLLANFQLAAVLDIQQFSDSTLNERGGAFQRAVMQGIGRMLGLGLADESADLTVQSYDSAFVAPGVGSEIVLPGDVDIVHGQYLYRPDSTDIDLYQFSLPVAGRMTIEAFAERMGKDSLLDSHIRLFQQTATGWEEIAANDDYFSSDSFLELELAQGNYIVGVSASGNYGYDPAIADSGIGGRSEGSYQLRMDFQPPATAVLRDGDASSLSGTQFDGDGDGVPGGVFDFWFKPSNETTTKFVDKSAPAGGNGTLAAPFNEIDRALAVAVPGNVVRILGNGGTDKLLATQSDNFAYEIGFNNAGGTLVDGATLDVPRGVTVMIDAGAILKLRRARIGVGSTSVSVDRSAGALLVLGTPTLQTEAGVVLTDAAGDQIAGSVFMTSLNDNSLGKSSTLSNGSALPGDWGGIDIRSRVDAANGRNVFEDQGLFLNWVSNADLRFGGGQVVVDGVSQVITPVQMVDARPTIISSSIINSADAAISATPNSFRESNFQSPAEQGFTTTPFSVDYTRVGPEIENIRATGNSINGLQVRIRTSSSSSQLEKLTVQGRFDDTDIVHFLPENLEIQGTPGGAVEEVAGFSSTRVNVAAQTGGTLTTGFYRYLLTRVDAAGKESFPSSTTFVQRIGTGSVVISNIPPAASRIYRSGPDGNGPFVLIGQLNGTGGTFVDNGSNLGTQLTDRDFVNRLDARLAIDGGTIVKSQGARIEVGFGAQLIAEGTEGNPVVFTSINDNRYGAGGTFDTANRATTQAAAAGDWGGIYVGQTSKASLDNVVIALGGGTTRIEGGFADFNAVEVHQGDLRLTNSRLENNGSGAVTTSDPDRGGRGNNSAGVVFVRGAQPVVADNVITSNLGPAFSFNVSSLNSTFVQDRGRSTGRADFITGAADNQGPLISGNNLSSNTINGLVVRGGNLTTEGVWDDTDVVHVVLDEIVIPDHQHLGGLRLASSESESLVVKLSGANAGFRATGTAIDNADRIGGSIQVVGTPKHPVILTSLNDDSVGAGFTNTGAEQTDTNNDGSNSSATAGQWNGIRLETFSNDRNVALGFELESPLSNAPSTNNSPSSAQFVGSLAPNEKAGDENLRLGFQIGGTLSSVVDADVYSFSGTAGTEVWFDIDRTHTSLDTIIELVDAGGRTLALSDNSFAEEANPGLLFAAAELAQGTVNPLRKSTPESYFQSALGDPKDLYSTNPKDAGMRVVLPGEAGSSNIYHVRVRSKDQLSSGNYQLQIRLSEVDEIPGSGISYADIRFATTGVRLVGVPLNSPLLGENSEVEVNAGGARNNTFGNAQALGNLLATNRQAISVAGNLDDFTDVDWFSFDLHYENITPHSIQDYFAAIFDIDYAEGIGRPDTSLYIFDENGNLILAGLGSELVDDQTVPGEGADSSALSRGSAGTLDPYIGPYDLLAASTRPSGPSLTTGRYFVAVTNSEMAPEVLAAYTDPASTERGLRMQPIEGIALIAEDHVRFQGGSTALPPQIPILFPQAGDFDGSTIYTAANDSVVDYLLSDVVLYVSQDVGLEQTNIYIVNPFTGEVRSQVGRAGADIQDIAYRPNGTLQAYDRTIEAQVGANVDLDGLSDYFTIDTGTAAIADIGDLGLQTSHLQFDANGVPTVAASDDGFNVEAITFAIIGNQERGILVGSRPSPPGFQPQYYDTTRFINNNGQPGFDRPGPGYFSNVIYEFNENTGAAISNPAADKTNLAVASGAGTEVRDRGYIETFTLDNAGNIVTRATQLIALEATTFSPSTGVNLALRDGDFFILEDAGGTQTRFEFDFGPEVIVRLDTVPGLTITDGLQFTLDGATYEFDTSAVPSVSPGAVRIPISSTPTGLEFYDAIAQRVPGNINVSYDSGRMNFGGAVTSNFANLVSAGIVTNLGSSGAVAAGSIPVSVLAGDTAQIVASRVAAAVNNSGIPTLLAATNGDQILFGGAEVAFSGPLKEFGVAPGGIVTGIAVIRNPVTNLDIMYAVSDEGGLYSVVNPIALRTGNAASYVTTSYDLVGINFTGLVAGPTHLSNGQYSQLLFGIDSNGDIHAFDTQGRLQPVFANGATSVSTDLQFANGLAMPALDFNLWHVTGNRNNNPGHGLPSTPNDSRAATVNGGSSLYFGFQSNTANGVPDLTGPNATGLTNSYNFPGGAAGAIESAPFDLSGVTEGDLPTLYFNYFFDAEETQSDLPLANNANDYKRDSLRVYAAGEDGQWVLIATNNLAEPDPTLSNRGNFDDEFDVALSGSLDVQPLFDIKTQTGNTNDEWRQARIPLGALAGQQNVRLRIEFSTYGGFGYGMEGGKGPEIRTISGDRLVDGETLVVNGQVFEIEMGPSLSLPAGASLTNGDSLTVDGTRYVFTDGSLTVPAPDIAVLYTTSMTAGQVAQQLAAAISNGTPNIPDVAGQSFNRESNEIMARSVSTGVVGDTVRVTGAAAIGDNASLANAGLDVDMFHIDVEEGALIRVAIEAESIGSSLDSFLRIFDANGQQLFQNDNQPTTTDSLITFTAPSTGRYYIGVSGTGNSGYNPAVSGTATIGSTGAYNLVVTAIRSVTPIVSGNRLQLEGGKNIVVPVGSPIVLQGSKGTTGFPVNVNVGMTAEQVATALQQSLANFFAGGNTGVYPVRSNVVDVTGLVNYDNFDFVTGLRTPSAFSLNAGPFGATTNYVGDAFGAFNTGTLFNGNTNNSNPGALGAQNNDFEGIYLDDFIVGIAGRGEMVLGQTAANGNTNFIPEPQNTLANPRQDRPDQGRREIIVGEYQLEIRGGNETGIPLIEGAPATLVLVDSLPVDALLSDALTIRFNSAASMVPGTTFTVSDGTRVLTFEMDDVNDGLAVQAGNIALPYSTLSTDPVTGITTSETGKDIAARFRDIINSSTVHSTFGLSANLANNDREGATSDTVVLIGQASANIPSSVGTSTVTSGRGGENRERPQGQIIINATRVSDSQQFGISVESAGRDPVTGASLLGSPRNTVTLNDNGLAPGAVVMNSEFLFNGAGGISISGDADTVGQPDAAVPFIRLVNNTILGGTVTESAGTETFTAGGQGIVVANNATATLLNNVIVNTVTGINVDASSASTVIGGTVFQRNTNNVAGSASLGQFPLNIPASVQLFVSAADGNLYPAAGSPVIDSSIDSLEDRPSLVAVKRPLGISPSPILSPQFDINGLLRVDDPSVETPSGLGENVFKDRGAQDRADFVGPSLVLINPVDNDFAGVDNNPTEGVVELIGITPRFFDIQIIDGIEPSDPSSGAGVDNSTVNASSVLLFRNNEPLVEGRDYLFGYNSTSGTIRLTPLAGIWQPESVYTIRFLNRSESSVGALAPAQYTDGEQFAVTDSTGATTTFELDLGYRITVPGGTSIDPTTLDGTTFTLDDGSARVTFEFDTNSTTSSTSRTINILGLTTAEAIGRAIENAVNVAGLNLTIQEIGAGQLQIQGSRLITLDPVDSGLLVTGKPGVQTEFGLQIPLQAGQATGLSDGQTFSIDRTGSPTLFEFDTNGVTQPGNVPVFFSLGATTQQIADALIAAIDGAALGLTPAYLGGGLIGLGGDSTTVLDLSNTVLTQAGIAGQPTVVAINISAAATVTSTDVAILIEQAIDARNLPGVTTTRFGDQVMIFGASSVTGSGATPVSAIRDLAGNTLKANQLDGTTTLTVFLGEGKDYGDAPAPYTSTAASGGPTHTIVDGLSIGPTVTSDADARLDNLDSDDGVTFARLAASFPGSANVEVTNTLGGSTAFVSMWIDFNGDGFFSDFERVANALPVTGPSRTIPFIVPATTTNESVAQPLSKIGDTYARIRLSTDAASIATATGDAPDGEVSDYVVTIEGNPYTNNSGITDEFGNGLDVSGDGFVSPIDVLQVINWINDENVSNILSLGNASGNPPYVDVNGDGIVSAADVNILITYLNSSAASGEGESTSDSLAEGTLLTTQEPGNVALVLGSDWMRGIENLGRSAKSSQSSVGTLTDIALLETEEETTEFADPSSPQTLTAIESFWVDLGNSIDDEDEDDQSSASDLASSLLSSR